MSHNTFLKVQTQEITGKKSCTKESKPKEAKSVDVKTLGLPHSNKPIKPNCQEKKKKYQKKKQDYKNSISAMEDNAIEFEKKKGDRKFYNCLKKGYFNRNYPKPPKNQSWSGNFYAGD